MFLRRSFPPPFFFGGVRGVDNFVGNFFEKFRRIP